MPVLSLAGLRCWARVVGVHDGDTLTVVLEAFPGRFYKVNIRVHGIDTCEITSKNNEIKERAIRARNRLVEYLTGVKLDPCKPYTRTQIEKAVCENVNVVWVECYEQEKYGRTLANLYPDCNGCASVAQVLLDEKLAYAYDGGRKMSESDMSSNT
eukprot:gene19679-26366_t